jgi:hypothetical protein
LSNSDEDRATTPAAATLAAPEQAVTNAAAGAVHPGAILLLDNMDDPSRGVLPTRFSDPSASAGGYEAGEYVLRTIDPGLRTLTGALLPGTFTNASIALDIRVVGDATGRELALACRVQADDSEYLFVLSIGTGSAWIVRAGGGQQTALSQPRTIQLRGDGLPDRFEFRCASERLTAYANSQQVGVATDSTYGTGRIGILAGNFHGEAGTVEAHLTNLVVTQL